MPSGAPSLGVLKSSRSVRCLGSVPTTWNCLLNPFSLPGAGEGCEGSCLGFWLSSCPWCCWAHDWREGERSEVPRMRNVGRHCSALLRTCRVGASLHLALVGVRTLAPHLVVTKAVWSPCSCLVSREIWAASGWEGVVLFSATPRLLRSCGYH